MDIFCLFVMLSCLVMSPCGHLLGMAALFVLLYVMLYCVLSLSHMVSWVRCGA